MKNKNGKRKPIGIIVAALLAVVLIVVNVLASTTFYSLLNTVMPGGGERAVFADASEARFVSDYGSKKEALQGAEHAARRLLVAFFKAGLVEAAFAGHRGQQFLVIDLEAEFLRQQPGHAQTACADLASDGNDQMRVHIALVRFS